MLYKLNKLSSAGFVSILLLAVHNLSRSRNTSIKKRKGEQHMDLKGTRTEANLRSAFAGETQARSKYDYFAKAAEKEGFQQIAAIFRETARYVKLPQIIDFTDKDGHDRMQEEIQANYDRIRQEVRQIVEDEITRIKNDPELCHLIKEEE